MLAKRLESLAYLQRGLPEGSRRCLGAQDSSLRPHLDNTPLRGSASAV